MPRAPRVYGVPDVEEKPPETPAQKLSQPDELQILKAAAVPQGGILLVKVPHPHGTAAFEVACRNIRNFCHAFQSEPYFFGSDQDFEAFALEDTTLDRLGLQRR